MPTSTFSIATDADDGAGYWEHTGVPPTGGTFNVDDGTSVYATKGIFGGNYVYEIGLLRFDTSSLTSAATVSAASLKMYCEVVVDNSEGFSLVADYYDFGGEPTVSADYTETASPSIFTAVPLASGFTASAVKTIALTDLTGISKTGYTGIRLTLTSGTPSGQNFVQFASHESASQEAQLDVTYTVAVQSLRPDADTTTTGWTSTPLFSKINESSPDGTVITATAS